jgi:hypothetical protein
LERATDVAWQIEVLLLGLAKRAESAELTALAERLRAVAADAAREANGGRQSGPAAAQTPQNVRTPQKS